MKRISVLLPDELVDRMVEWAKAHEQASLLSGVQWSTTVRYLLKVGLEQEGY